jgi:hypothetical protein
MTPRQSSFVSALLLMLAVSDAAAQDPAHGKDRAWEILDNSFLVEESFNQERGIFQNIVSWTFAGKGEWTGSFTQEWPMPGKTHQLSYTIPLTATASGTGLDDVLVNYRYQLLDEKAGRPAVSPRISMILPTGRTEVGIGHGVVGVQVNVPASKQFGNLYVHANAGWTWFPRVETEPGVSVNLFSPHVGGSIIWRVAPMLNLMLESFAEFEELVDPNGSVNREATVTVSPGLRRGWNIGDRQIVIGAAVPLNRTQGETSPALLTYFSYELPFKK